MQSTSLIVMCVFMTLGMALAMYGGGSYGYSYVPYVPPQQGSGLGEGGLLMLFGFFFIFFLLIQNSSLFNTTSSTPTVSIIQA